MNTTEIRALVAQKIAGQGMMVDAGASLQPIVESICDLLDALTPERIVENATLTVNKVDGDIMEVSAQEMATALGITTEELDGLIEGKYLRLRVADVGIFQVSIKEGENSTGICALFCTFVDSDLNSCYQFEIIRGADDYSLILNLY